jgi:hypothetical protein
MVDILSYEPKPDVAFWGVRAGQGGRYASDFEAKGLAVIGFHPVGDISGLPREQVSPECRRFLPARSGRLSR